MEDAVKYTTSNLLEFEMLIDTDLSVIQTMLKKYPNSNFFRDNVLHASSINVIKNLLLFRKDRNPLSILIKPEYINSIDDLYKELIDSCRDEIINNSHPTDIFRFVKTLNDTGGIINNTITCNNELEYNFLKSNDSTLVLRIKENDLTNYNCLFIKYIDDIPKYINYGGKYVFITNAMYNLSSSFIPKQIAVLALEYNRIRTIDPYKGLTVPTGGIRK